MKINPSLAKSTLFFAAIGFFNAQSGADVLLLPEVKVTARRSEELKARVAANIQVIDAEAIENSGAESVVDLLESVGNIYLINFTESPAGADVTLRGFGENASARVVVIIDGQKVNRPDLGRTAFEQIPLGAIEKIEVIKGAQTAFYGNNAVGGVIKITTKSGASVDGGAVGVEVQSDQTSILRASTGGAEGKLDYGVALEHYETDGFRDNGDFDSITVNLRGGYALSDTTSLKASGTYTDSTAGLPGSINETNPNRRASTDDPRNETRGEFGLFSVMLEHGFSEEVSLQLDVSLSDQKNGTDHFDWFSFLDQDLQVLAFAPRMLWEADAFTAVGGLDVVWEDLRVDNFGSVARAVRTSYADIERSHAGGYIGGDVKVGEKLRLNAAARIESLSLDAANEDLVDDAKDFGESSDETEWSVQLGAIFNFNESSRTYARFDRLYRYPLVDEVANITGFLPEPFNADLKPESGYQVEVGHEQRAGQFFFAANFFAQWLEDEIGYDLMTRANENLEDTRRLGIELEGSHRGERHEVLVRYDWVRAEFDAGVNDGRDIPQVPQHRFTVTGIYEVLDGLRAQARYRYVSDSYVNGDKANAGPELDGFQRVDLMLRYEPVQHLAFFAGVDNVFGEEYSTQGFIHADYPPPNYSPVYDGTLDLYPLPARTFKAGVRMRF